MKTTPKNESRVLADVFQNVRGLTKYYLNKLKDIDPHLTYTANGTPLNSIYWLVGHIVWAENFLILEGLGEKHSNTKWINYFRLGAEKSLPPDIPQYKEILHEMDKIHMSAIKLILSLSSQELDKNNLVNLSFGTNDDYSKRMLLHHAIRHEPCHVGHLGWICKMNGIRTI